VITTGIIPFQSEEILPIPSPSYRICGVSIRKVFQKVHHGDQGSPPWCSGGLPICGKHLGTILIAIAPFPPVPLGWLRLGRDSSLVAGWPVSPSFVDVSLSFSAPFQRFASSNACAGTHQRPGKRIPPDVSTRRPTSTLGVTRTPLSRPNHLGLVPGKHWRPVLAFLRHSTQ
jgi:hypothetical protein